METRLPVKNLDVLRAVAVLSVVADHVGQLFGSRAGPLSVWELGRMGVLLFFVHTALVLMSSLERQGSGERWVTAFYIRRAFRIYPLAMVCTLVYVSLHIPASVRSLANPTTFMPLSRGDVIKNLALVQNLFGTPLPINVLWSLPIEVQMYVALPLCYLIARRGPWSVAVLLAAAAGLWVCGISFELPGFWRLTVVNYGPCFLSGVLAYALLRKPLTRSSLPGWTRYLVIVGVVGLTAGLHPGDESMPRNWLVCLPIGLAIPFIRELGASRLTRIAKVVCEYSYGIYLTHVAALWLAFVYFRELARAEQFAIFAATAALFAYASYHLIERPFVSTGKRIASLVTRQRVGGLSAAIDTTL